MRLQSIAPSIFAIVVLLLAFFFLEDEVNLLQNSSVESATVTACDSKTFGSSARRGNRNTQYATVAVTESGLNVTGPYLHPSRSICEKRLYRDTTVFVSDRDDRLSRINSFYDFWLAPFYFMVLFLTFVLGALKSTAAGRKFGYAIHFLHMTVPVLFLGFYWMDYETKPNSAALAAGDETAAATQFSNDLLDRCISRTLREGGYEHERDIQKLSCQKMNISNLSRLEGLTGLERLYLQSNKLDNLNTLPNLPNLKTMSIAANKMTSLSGILNAPNLEELQSNTNDVTSIKELGALNRLHTVAFMFNGISDLSPLAEMKHLKSVNFNHNEISDISALANKPALAEVNLYSNKITDISPLFENRGLEELNMVGKVNTIRCEQVEQLLSHVSFKIHESWRTRCH